jgi:hypothetical protein
VNWSQGILKKFLSAVFTGSALEFSATCWGYVCGILKLTRFAQVRLDGDQCYKNILSFHRGCLIG